MAYECWKCISNKQHTQVLLQNAQKQMYCNCNTFGTMPLNKIKQNCHCATDQKFKHNTDNN